ncbi:phosphoribosylamine--glycine ligase [candidate division WOR-3 bacterium]|nr:phosphoribosylamine--glycine ligase [candidate division WOR-3 bacterium]
MKDKKVAVIGKGAREHALAESLLEDENVSDVYCLPGNPGTEKNCRNVEVDTGDNPKILDAVKAITPELVVVGPEDPLSSGISDLLRAHGFVVFGPGAKGASIESDKSFAKKIMTQTGIPTAKWNKVASIEKLYRALDEIKPPYVLKASGLAQGKGVFICRDGKEAAGIGQEMLSGKLLGEAGKKIVVEEFLEGFELSFFFATDGLNIVWLPTAHDHKKAFEGDRGPNTGGMGSLSPVGETLTRTVEDYIALPLLDYFKTENIQYRGLVFIGAIVSMGKVYVLEFNCRFGDPETQSILAQIEGGFFDLLYSCARGKAESALQISDDKSVSVVIASKGYPLKYEKGKTISFARQPLSRNASVFYAGVERQGRSLVTSGGRVFTVSGVGKSFETARKKAYEDAEKIKFDGAWMRMDIGKNIPEDLF